MLYERSIEAVGESILAHKMKEAAAVENKRMRKLCGINVAPTCRPPEETVKNPWRDTIRSDDRNKVLKAMIVGRDYTVAEISDRIGLSRSAVSAHMRVLRSMKKVDMVGKTKEDKQVWIYRRIAE